MKANIYIPTFIRKVLSVTSVVVLITFAWLYPLRGSAEESVDPLPESPALPRVKNSKGIYYPERAKRDGLEGKVLVAFDIDAGGRVSHLAVLDSDDSVFEATAREYLTGLQFDVPSDWSKSAAHLIRYHIGFLFCIPPSSLDLTFGVPANPVIISTNRITGSPIRHPLVPGADAKCATYPLSPR